jgi:hypothetical protein
MPTSVAEFSLQQKLEAFLGKAIYSPLIGRDDWK